MISRIILFFVISFSSTFPALATDSWQGDWQGKLQVRSDSTLTLILHIHSADGQLNATLDSPDQGATGIPASDIRNDHGHLLIEFAAIGATYQSTLKQDHLQGTFSQAGHLFPLNLHRQSAEQRQANQASQRRPQEPHPPYPYIEQQVSFINQSAQIRLAGTLTKPKGPGPFSCALLVSGSGPQDRDETIMGHKPFKVLADYLTRRGFAVLRVDDRGTGQSEGDFATADLADFVTDINAAFTYLRQRNDINPDAIGLIGHSEGGITGPMFASQQPKVAFVIMLAGLGVSGTKLWATQQRDLFAAAGAENTEKLYQLQLQAAQMAANGADQATLAAFYRQHHFPKAQVKQYSKMLGSRWGHAFMAYDPRKVLSHVKAPLLALNGDKDIQVDASANLKGIRQIMAHSGNIDVTIKALPGLNHLFQQADTGSPDEYASIKETINPKALKVIGDWLNARF